MALESDLEDAVTITFKTISAFGHDYGYTTILVVILCILAFIVWCPIADAIDESERKERYRLEIERIHSLFLDVKKQHSLVREHESSSHETSRSHREEVR